MITGFRCISNDVCYIKVNGIALPMYATSFDIEDFDDSYVEVFLRCGKRYGGVISLCEEGDSGISGISYCQIADHSYVLNVKNNNNGERVEHQEKIEFGGGEHQLTYIVGECNRIIIENGNCFQTIDLGDDCYVLCKNIANYLFLVCKSQCVIVEFESDYKIVEKVQVDEVKCGDANAVTTIYKTPTTEGYIIKRRYYMDSGKLNCKKQVEIEREGCYQGNLLALVLFERVLYLDDDYVLELLSSDFEKEDVAKLKSYLGDYKNVVPCGENSCVLVYEDGSIKCFYVQTYGNVVGNILKR